MRSAFLGERGVSLTVRGGDQAYVEQFRKTRMLRVPVSSGSVVDQIESFRRALRRQLEAEGRRETK